MSDDILVLAYAGCDTCRKALKWLEARGVPHRTRAIVEAPPTVAELRQWIPKSGVSVRKWLNTSGQSYRALGKEKVDAASDAELVEWLAKDGKLVKRPVLVTKESVTVGFKPETYEALFPLHAS
ncbi:Spx/MgsR family RNA polymerase-binding regulatory protein [Corallococcus exiguus]|uniref:Spx/MgsR family RNA polymerase-binding regulatory protein n=1 Tax=Corallococcus exiguus TaxID=83462 RepID=UPI001470E3EC|nr:Spx/MgsR family RNA polymerase-binding regulatory protein [Corallococcus exiguus]NNB84044.1 Spx/MgsR family RNA polymerase-binding regulatory protein [Corallococcus exiguus]NNC02126.1 Spx/MgsR family RNA polymerase-binding regulatory protein [Corallococcus exiguus]